MTHRILKYATLMVACLLNGSLLAQEQDLVSGNLIQFNDNGAWSWYQDERAIADVAAGKLIVGSNANGSGVGGSPRNGDIEAVIFDVKTGISQRYTLMQGGSNFGGSDDHNAPAFLKLPNGNYLAFYAGHNNNNFSYWRIFSNGNWGNEQSWDWNGIPGGTDFATTYSNVFYLSQEDRVYNIARTFARSPNMMVSDDQAGSWAYGGLLTQPDQSIGYVNGYFKYWSNGVDRIDFVATEHHPRDFNTSIYHGYIKGGQSFRSDGTLVDSDISDKDAPKPADFTLVFAANTVVNDITMTRCWNIDLVTYDNGDIATIFKARANDSEQDHRFFYARYSGESWDTTYLGKAGGKMYRTEEDYIGLGALDPNNPNVLYLSTPFDPNDDTALNVREIYKGMTKDNGASWTWNAITRNSVRDNFRPIVPAWDAPNTAVLWWRGTYNTAQIFDAAVVGVLERRNEAVGRMSYTDANANNTTRSNGSPIGNTGPSSGQGGSDNQWHERTGFGNNGSVLTSAEIGGEDAPTLKTEATVPVDGTYDVWVNFWATTTDDWRIKAGLSTDNMQIFRQMASKQVEAGDHNPEITLADDNGIFLYQAYVGRVQRSQDESITVFVDDESIQTGSSNSRVGNTARTWYDGISYAMVVSGALPVELAAFNVEVAGNNVELTWTTATETDNFGFEIQRSGAGGPWQKVAFIPGHGTVNSPRNYSYRDAGLQPGTRQYRLKQIDTDGDFEYSQIRSISIAAPKDFLLAHNFPNPFNPSTIINFQLPNDEKVVLTIFNLRGQVVRTLLNEERKAGFQSVVWDGKDNSGRIVNSGVYLCNLQAGGRTLSQKMTMLK